MKCEFARSLLLLLPKGFFGDENHRTKTTLGELSQGKTIQQTKNI